MALRNSHITLLSIAIFAGALCLGLAGNSFSGAHREDEFVWDELKYFRLSRELAATGTFGTPDDIAGTVPMYPIVLAGVFSVFGPSKWLAGVVQVVFNALNVVLAFTIGRKLVDVRTGLLAALLVPVESFWWFTNSHLMTEPLQATCVGSMVLLLLNLDREQGVRRTLYIVAAGVLFAVTQLLKPSMLPLPFAVAASLVLFPSLRRKEFLLGVTLFFCAAVLTWSPWWIRNYLHFRTFVPFTTASGQVFFGAHWSENPFRGAWINPPDVDFTDRIEQIGRARRRPVSAPERERIEDQLKWQLGREVVERRGMGTMLIHEACKFARFWSPSPFIAADDLGTKVVKLLWTGASAAILIGFVLSTRRTYNGWLSWIFLLSALATCLVFWGTLRFRYPFLPIICSFAAAWYRSAASRLRAVT